MNKTVQITKAIANTRLNYNKNLNYTTSNGGVAELKPSKNPINNLEYNINPVTEPEEYYQKLKSAPAIIYYKNVAKDGWYITCPNGVVVTGYEPLNTTRDEMTKVVIPDTINGKPVVAIANEVFYKCECLSSVKFPKWLVAIGSKAFYGCVSLNKLNLPLTLMVIFSSAFDCCNHGFRSCGIKNIKIRKTCLNMGFTGIYRSELTEYRVSPQF